MHQQVLYATYNKMRLLSCTGLRDYFPVKNYLTSFYNGEREGIYCVAQTVSYKYHQLNIKYKMMPLLSNCITQNYSEVHKWTARILTAFEKDMQQTARSNSPIPITANVWRLTEFHTRTWGCKNPHEWKITVSAAERNTILYKVCQHFRMLLYKSYSVKMLYQHMANYQLLHPCGYLKMLYHAVQHQFQLWTSFMLTPASGKHYSLLPPTIPLKVFIGVPRNFWGGGSTNSLEDRGQRERGSGGRSPIVRGYTQFEFANEWNPYSD
jgi:hypothetical protein